MHVLRELAQLLRLSGFRRLFAVRLASQSADGLFQIGLATLFFFSPERQSSAEQVALAFAVLLLPFTIVGPWAGVFLDRWRRRQVLLFANLIRASLTLLIAVLMIATPSGHDLGWPIYVLALMVLSINRFLLSALSAGLPHVVDGPLLLTANSLLPTLGGAAAGVGAGVGLLLGLLLPSGHLQDSAAVLIAAAAMVLASGLATRLGRDQLGPDHEEATPPLGTAIRRIAADLLGGARYLVRRGTPGQALLIMATHRFLFGVTLVASILISRNLLTASDPDSAGLGNFTLIAGATGVGFAAAVVVTPLLSPRVGMHRWITLCLILGAVGQGVVTAHVSLMTMVVCGAILGLSAQSAKIAVDTIVQRDTADIFRGRAFALYDMLYNAGFVGAAALAALLVPDEGYGFWLFAGLTTAYLGAAAVFEFLGATEAREVV